MTTASRKAMYLRTITVRARSISAGNARNSTGFSRNCCAKISRKRLHPQNQTACINPLQMSFRTIKKIRWMRRVRIFANRKIKSSTSKTVIPGIKILHLQVGSRKLQRQSLVLRKTLRHTSIDNIQDSFSQEVQRQ